MPSSATPNALGYRFPAEWEPQAAVWFAWPTRDDLWEGVFERVRQQLAALYVLAARYQPVRVLCPAFAQEDLRALMHQAGDASQVELYDYQADDVWIRDYGPLFLLNADASEAVIADWTYNAWGNKYPKQARDRAASAWIAEQLGIRRFQIDSVLEGGAVESNGAGALLTSEAVLLNPNRNGPTSIAEMDRRLADGLAVDQVLWLEDGLAGDDTDGHIDNLARFFKPDGILMAAAPSVGDVNASALEENERRIRNFQTKDGKPFEVVAIPLPDPVLLEGEPLAASYMNYLVLNGAVLVPTYNQPERDAQALQILGDCFPGREIVGFDCSDILHEGGAIHCMSQHQPALSQ